MLSIQNLNFLQINSNKKGIPIRDTFYFFIMMIYAGCIALVGHTSAQVPQSVHVSASIL